VEGQRLCHEEGLETCRLQSFLHDLDRCEDGRWIKVTVDADDVGAGEDHADRALSRSLAVEVSVRPDAHRSGDGEICLLGDLYRPFYLLYVLEIFADQEVGLVCNEDVHLGKTKKE